VLETYEVEASKELYGSVVWMHGLGATNHDFDDVVPMLRLPHVRFVFPQAPELPVTINGGARMPAWYDILTLADPPIREDERTVRASAALVEAVVQRELDRGVRSDRVVLMGFSQGGAMALHVGTRFKSPLAGIGVLSGCLLVPDRLLGEWHSENHTTPMLFCHGTMDPVVPFRLGRQAYEAVHAQNPAAEFHSFPMPHTLCLPEIELLGRWLERRCGGE
jgi:phospholipase/carboxylesterase